MTSMERAKENNETCIPLPDGPKWFCAMTKPSQEGIAATWLRRAGYWATFPMDRYRRRIKRPHGRTIVKWIEAPHFPRYIFVALTHVNQPIGPINAIKGVSRLVCRRLSGEPLQIPTSVMDALRGERLFELDDGRGAIVMSETHMQGDRELRVFVGSLGKWKCEQVAA